VRSEEEEFFLKPLLPLLLPDPLPELALEEELFSEAPEASIEESEDSLPFTIFFDPEDLSLLLELPKSLFTDPGDRLICRLTIV